MPLHAVTSTVRPAYYMYGQGGYQGANAIMFPMYVFFCPRHGLDESSLVLGGSDKILSRENYSASWRMCRFGCG